jgi:endonuclease/exonuclease/phosphatase (EEP) superfamily protein YafD
MDHFLVGVSTFFITGTAFSLFSHDHWAIRLFDFPRKQLAIGIAAALVGFVVVGPSSLVEYGTLVLLAACFVYQFDHILPYTPLAPREVRGAVKKAKGSEKISFLIANVEIDNRNPDRFLDLVAEENPDVVLALETDHWWMEQLAPLRRKYSHSLRHPRDNAYGMCLYSRHPLLSPHVRFLVEDDVPSIHTRILLPSGQRVWFHGMHTPTSSSPRARHDRT